MKRHAYTNPSPAPPPACTLLQWRRVWSTPGAYTRTVRIEREAHSGEVTSLSTSPCGSLLASSSVDGTVALWDLTAAAAAGPLRPRLLGQAQHPGPVLWVRLLGPDTAASATAGALFLWRMEPQQGGAGGGAMAAASSSSGGSSGGSCRRQLEFRLLRRIAVGGRLTCAAAWDMYLAAGCGERPYFVGCLLVPISAYLPCCLCMWLAAAVSEESTGQWSACGRGAVLPWASTLHAAPPICPDLPARSSSVSVYNFLPTHPLPAVLCCAVEAIARCGPVTCTLLPCTHPCLTHLTAPLRPSHLPLAPALLCAADGAVRIYDAYSGALSKLLRLHGGSVAVLQHVAHGELDLLVRWALVARAAGRLSSPSMPCSDPAAERCPS